MKSLGAFPPAVAATAAELRVARTVEERAEAACGFVKALALDALALKTLWDLPTLWGPPSVVALIDGVGSLDGVLLGLDCFEPVIPAAACCKGEACLPLCRCWMLGSTF